MRLFDQWVRNSAPFQNLTARLDALDAKYRQLHARHVALLVYTAHLKGAGDVELHLVNDAIARLSILGVFDGELGGPVSPKDYKHTTELVRDVAAGRYRAE